MIVPVRFLSLLAHLVITIALFWSKDAIVSSCTIDEVNMQDAASQKNTQLIVGLSFTLFLTLCELVGQFSGLSMFTDLPSLLSIFFHVSASICLCLYWTLVWHCDTFWYIFAFGSVLPFLSEVITVLYVLRRRIL